MHILKKMILIGAFVLVLSGCTSNNIQASESVVENSITSEIVSSISGSSESLESKSNIKNSSFTDMGGVLSISALFISVYTVIMERRNRKEDKVDNTFFNLIGLHNSIKDKIDGRVINSVYNDIVKTAELINEKYIENENIKLQNKYITIKWEEIRDIIQELKCSTDEKHEIIVNNWTASMRTIDPLVELDKKLNEELNTENLDEIRYLITLVDQNYVFFKTNNTKVFDEYLNINVDPYSFNENEKNNICSAIYEKYYDEVGNYFRIFHRVIKYVNRNVEKMETKRNYIGILRALLSETEMLVIFYNSFYTDKGSGLGKQLLDTSFFGDKKDLPLSTESKELQHFSRKNLIFGEADIRKMRECELKKSKRNVKDE